MTLFKKPTVASLSIGAVLFTTAMTNVAFGHGDDHHGKEPKAQQARITIDGGFHPAQIQVHAGREVHLTLIRKEVQGCGDVVRFSDLTEIVDGKEVPIERSLKTGERTTITFTPKDKGTLHLACGMGMYKGSIAVK